MLMEVLIILRFVPFKIHAGSLVGCESSGQWSVKKYAIDPDERLLARPFDEGRAFSKPYSPKLRLK